MRVETYTIRNPRDLQIQRNLESIESISSKKISSLVMEYFTLGDLTLDYRPSFAEQAVQKFTLRQRNSDLKLGIITFQWITGKESHLHIDYLGVNKEYENLGLGTLLMRALVECSVKFQCPGKINLITSMTSHWWYKTRGYLIAKANNWKLGDWLDTPDEESNRTLALLIEQAKLKGETPNSTQFLISYMFLPEAARAGWIDLVTKEPLLLPPAN